MHNAFVRIITDLSQKELDDIVDTVSTHMEKKDSTKSQDKTLEQKRKELTEYVKLARTQGLDALKKKVRQDIEEKRKPMIETDSEMN